MRSSTPPLLWSLKHGSAEGGCIMLTCMRSLYQCCNSIWQLRLVCLKMLCCRPLPAAPWHPPADQLLPAATHLGSQLPVRAAKDAGQAEVRKLELPCRPQQQTRQDALSDAAAAATALPAPGLHPASRTLMLKICSAAVQAGLV